MKKEWRDWARDVLAHYGQDFDSRLVFENDDFFIMDWKDRNGSGNLATRYIVDKGRGDLIITGDAGDCIASWEDQRKAGEQLREPHVRVPGTWKSDCGRHRDHEG